DQVEDAIRTAGVDPKNLTAQELELLRVPFNLQLYLEADPTTGGRFRSLKDLFDRFWDSKRKLVGPKLKDPHGWDECIRTLAKALSTGASSAPVDALDTCREDANILASYGIIVLENRRWRF